MNNILNRLGFKLTKQQAQREMFDKLIPKRQLGNVWKNNIDKPEIHYENLARYADEKAREVADPVIAYR